ncbi:MAG: hypothetical protein NVS3B1_22120 [Marmoricola sp.]
MAAVDAAKNQPCAKCDESFPACVMDLHHTRDKRFQLTHARVREHSLEVVLAEIAKCIPLCANCHRVLHYVHNRADNDSRDIGAIAAWEARRAARRQVRTP